MIKMGNVEHNILLPLVNFINVLSLHFLYKKLAPKIQSQKVSRKKLLTDSCMKKVSVKD